MPITSSKNARTRHGVCTVEEVALVVTREAAPDGLLNGLDGDIVAALTADGEVMMLALAVEMHREGEVLGGRELWQALLSSSALVQR